VNARAVAASGELKFVLLNRRNQRSGAATKKKASGINDKMIN